MAVDCGTPFYEWLATCPVHVDYSHEIENEDDTQVYYYFIFDKAKGTVTGDE
jgi:hypothetical protein